MVSTVKSTQEQATAACIAYLNSLRNLRLQIFLAAQDERLKQALAILAAMKKNIQTDLVDKNRGGPTGLHGFIAEYFEAGIANARRALQGLSANTELVNDNGPVDIIVDGIKIQMKFVQKNLGLNAVIEHLKKNPNFLKKGGVYAIPKDFFEILEKIASLSAEEAGKLPSDQYRLWKLWQQISEEFGITLEDFRAAIFRYDQVQAGVYKKTASNAEEEIRKDDAAARASAVDASKPTIKEAGTVMAGSAALECGMQFCLCVAKKMRSGKKLPEFTNDDWKDAGIQGAKGAGKGTVRGGAVYGFTNFTNTPAAVATAMVTASFGIVDQANQLRAGVITNEDFIINSQVVCLDVAVSAISATCGQVMIPLPILGAIIGNMVGMFAYEIAKNHLNTNEQRLLKEYQDSLSKLQQSLDIKHQDLMRQLTEELKNFKSLLAFTFDLDVNIAFAGSIALAQHIGVAEEKILKTDADIDAYFLGE